MFELLSLTTHLLVDDDLVKTAEIFSTEELVKVAYSAVPRSGHQRYNEALDRWRAGQRKTKPLPGQFGLEGLRSSPLHRTVDKVKELQPHQQHAVDFIEQHGGQGILAHSTGSGKTITAVKAVDRLIERGLAKKVLVVTPAGLRTNFLVEGVHRASDHKGSILAGSGERGEGIHHWKSPDPESVYHVVSYEIFREHPEEIIRNVGADTIVLDEFHRVKDPERNTFQSLERVRPLVKNVIGLTGSLVSTHPTNILQPIQAVTGGAHALGNQQQFEDRYLQRAGPQPRRPAMRLTNPATWLNFLRAPVPVKGSKKNEFVGWKNTDELRQKLQQHVHYVGPELVADRMPQKQVDTVRVEMSPLQEQVYRAALKELPPPLLRKLRAGQPLAEGEQGEVFNRVVKARQAANSVHALTGLTPHEAAPATPKLQKMLDDIEDHLESTPDGGVIVYTNLVHGGVDVIKAGLEQRGIPHGLFIGKGNEGVTEESRQRDVSDFKEGRKKVIIISGAGNEGVSLPNATFHAAYDGHWNPEKILQAEARGWRLGGQAHRDPESRRVHVRRYMTVWPESRSLMGKVKAYFKGQNESDAVDEWIYNWADRRHALNQQLFDLLKGQQPGQHSLFSGEHGMKTPAVARAVPTPRLDPNWQGAAAPASAEQPAVPASPRTSWWPWKTAAEKPGVGDTVPLLPDDELAGIHWTMAEIPDTENPGDGEPWDVILVSDKPGVVPARARIVAIADGGFDPKLFAVEPSVPAARAAKMVEAVRYVLRGLKDTSHLKKAEAQGTPEPQVGAKVRVRLEDRTKHDDFSVVPMGEIPNTLNAADGDPWDAIPIDVPLSKVKGVVSGTVIGRIKDRRGNHKLVVKSDDSPLTKRQRQDLQAYQAARQVWAGKMTMQVPGVKDVKTKIGAVADLVGLEGLEPHASQNDERGMPLPVGHPRKKPGPPWMLEPIIMDAGGYVDEHTKSVHALMPWLNKEPGLKAAEIMEAAAHDALIKAADEEGGVLSVIVRALDMAEKAAFRGQLGPVVRVGHSDRVRNIKRDLRGRFAGLAEPRGEPHVTLLYAHGLQDPAHPHLLDKVTRQLEKKRMKVRFTRLGTFNSAKRGVIYLAAEGADLHQTHHGLKQVALEHGGKMLHRTYRPHMTLFYRDRPFSPAERAEIGRMRVDPLEIERDRSHIDVTVKHGSGWKKLARALHEIPEGLLAASPELLKAALTAPPVVEPPAALEKVAEACVNLTQGTYAELHALAEIVEGAMRVMPEVISTRVGLSKEGGVRVSCTLREPVEAAELQERLRDALEPVLQAHSGISLKNASTGVLDDDLPPPAKRWVEPKHRRPACQVPNSEEVWKTHVELPHQGIPAHF